MRDRDTGNPRGFAFVVFKEDTIVDLVMQNLPHEINHKVVDVKRAHCRRGVLHLRAFTEVWMVQVQSSQDFLARVLDRPLIRRMGQGEGHPQAHRRPHRRICRRRNWRPPGSTGASCSDVAM